MKFSRFTSFPGRYAFWRHLFSALVSGSICLFSCEDDMDRPSLSPHVSFTSEISSSWTPSTRSTTDADVPQGTVIALQGGSTPLYLHTLYTDSIASPSSTIVRRGQLLPVPLPSRMTICTTVSVSPLTPTLVRGAKAEPPTTSIMPLPASPAVTMSFPPPIIGPGLHTK